MKYDKIFLKLIMLVPWLVVPLLGKRTIKRFATSATLMSLYVAGESVLAHKRNWWQINRKLHPKLLGELPLIIGRFL